MMLIHTCQKIDTNGAIWCILSVSKYVIMNLKSTILGQSVNNPNFVPYFSPRSTQMRTLAQK